MREERSVSNALSFEELNELKPSQEALSKNTRRAAYWYDEAVYTAARLFVEASGESEEFRKAFLSRETMEVDAFPEEDGYSPVESEKWREVLDEQCPEINRKLWSIGLSSFQGGSAEAKARAYLSDARGV